MKEYIIRKKTSWEQVPFLEINEKLRPFQADIKAYGQLMYDAEKLYVRLTAEEKEIRKEQTGKFDMPCKDSCLEFFFSPLPGERKYFNIEMNPNGSMFLGIGTGIEDLVRLSPMNQERYGFHPQTEISDTGWVLTYEIPLCFIRLFFPDFTMRSGGRMRGNLYKCGDECAVRHWLAWNPADAGVPHAFHNPDCFGTFLFE